jgi:hypothetical protein
MLKISNILQGGLGNYLFQISAGYAAALNQNKEYIGSLYGLQTGHNHISTYFNNILRKIKFTETPISNFAYKEIGFNFNKIPNFDKDIILTGYFQSEKYFKNYKNEIISLYEITEEDDSFLLEKYGNFKNSCSINVRRGDYLKLSNYHYNQTLDYYKKAVSMLDENLKYFIISDDIKWCKDNFIFLNNVIFVEDNKDYQDLYLVSKCEHNIITNSTFGWWGAWLNKNPNKKVICPNKWFGSAFHESFDDIYPEGWIRI